MKPRTHLSVATIFGVALMAGCGRGPDKAEIDLATRGAEQAAIQQVLQARLDARSECKRGPTVAGAKYVRLLHQIDTEKCPLPFRKVWLTYVHTWERNVEHPLSRLGALGEYAAGAVSAAQGQASGPALADSMKRLDSMDCNEAWRHIENVCLRYGITARRE